MITIKNVDTPDGVREEISIESATDGFIDGSGLTLIPAAIDPHVHFRTPGAEYKEDWMSGARAALSGGVTTVFDMPNNTPSCTTKEDLRNKEQLVKQQLRQAGIPLRHYFYLGVTKDNLDQLGICASEVVGFKIFMGSSTGDLLVDDPAILEEVFAAAAQLNKVVSVHAEDEASIQRNMRRLSNQNDPSIHSRIRERSAAIYATEQAIRLAQRYGTRLCILHTSTKEEIALAKAAKEEGVDVNIEVAPHHLFLDQEAYNRMQNRVKMNPPLRTEQDRLALWEGIHDGTVDFIGSDHAPHLVSEKDQNYKEAPAGVPGVETTLPLLLDACNRGWISLKQIIGLTRTNIQKIFSIVDNQDVVLIDTKLRRTVRSQMIVSKCGWSPYEGMALTGWPVLTITHGTVYDLGEQPCHSAN